MDEALVSCMSLCSKCFVLPRTHEAIASRRQATVATRDLVTVGK
jgi:hypothetical protein